LESDTDKEESAATARDTSEVSCVAKPLIDIDREASAVVARLASVVSATNAREYSLRIDALSNKNTVVFAAVPAGPVGPVEPKAPLLPVGPIGPVVPTAPAVPA